MNSESGCLKRMAKGAVWGNDSVPRKIEKGSGKGGGEGGLTDSDSHFTGVCPLEVLEVDDEEEDAKAKRVVQCHRAIDLQKPSIVS